MIDIKEIALDDDDFESNLNHESKFPIKSYYLIFLDC